MGYTVDGRKIIQQKYHIQYILYISLYPLSTVPSTVYQITGF